MDWSFCIIYQAGQDLRAKWTDGRLYDATVLYMHQGKEAITCILPVGFIARIILVMWDEDFIGLANAFWSYFNLFVVVINIYQLMAFAFNLNDEGHATWPKPLQTNFCLSLCFFLLLLLSFSCVLVLISLILWSSAFVTCNWTQTTVLSVKLNLV